MDRDLCGSLVAKTIERVVVVRRMKEYVDKPNAAES